MDEILRQIKHTHPNKFLSKTVATTLLPADEALLRKIARELSMTKSELIRAILLRVMHGDRK